MPNTNLPTNLTPGSTGHIADTNTVHAEVNRLSRATGSYDLRPLLVNGWTADRIRLERRDWMTVFDIVNLDGSAATDPTIFPLVTSAPGVSTDFFGSVARRSPLFQMLGGDTFYLAVSGGDMRAFFPGTAQASGPIGFQWILFHTATWPSFLPPAA